MVKSTKPADLIVVGGGLSGLLTAWFRLLAHPGESVLVLEAAEKVAGDHTWSFNLSDLDDELLSRLAPFIAHQWPAYEVRFPRFSRIISTAYASGNSASLRKAIEPLRAEGHLQICTSSPTRLAEPTAVTLDDGTVLRAKAVVDARGGFPVGQIRLAYQKFVGHTVRTETPHGVRHPLLMDATVDQIDGYRFLYCLPFSPTELLIEDTRYSNGPVLDAESYRRGIAQYAHQRGFQIQETLGTEAGVLPITLSQSHPVQDPRYASRIGLAAGLFHATTGYSFPDAVRLADHIAELPELTAADLRACICRYQTDHWRRQTFFRRLNRMLFYAGEESERYKVLQRFYGFDARLIGRFYAGALSGLDKARLLCGRPPVPVLPALSVLSETRFRRQHGEGV